MNTKKKNLEELMEERLSNGLSSYFEGGVNPRHCSANECSDCLACEDYCHDS